MTEQCPNVPLGELCEITGGGTPSTAVESYWKGDIPWVSPKDMKADVVCDSADHISPDAVQNSATSLVPKGAALVVVRSGILARTIPVALAGRELAINQDIKALKPSGKILSRYLYLFLRASEERLLGNVSRGATVHRLSTDALRFLPVPVPPLPEQRRIVAILDKAFAAIATAKANTEKNLQNARAVFESTLESIFASVRSRWPERHIGEIAKHSLGKMLDKAKNRGELRPYLRNINVRWFSFDLLDLLHMRFLPEESEKYTVRTGDVVICEGGYPGRAAIWNENYPIHFQKALHRVRFGRQDHAKWLVYYLYAQDKNGTLRNSFTGTGIQHFTGEALDRFRIPIPPPDELRKDLDKIEAISRETNRLENALRLKLEALKQLRDSVLHDAFSGAL